MRSLVLLLAAASIVSGCDGPAKRRDHQVNDPLTQARAAIVARNYGEAAERAGEAAEDEPDNPSAFFELSRAEVLRGNQTSGLKALRTAIERGLPDAARMLGDPAFDSIRGNNEFAELVERASPRSPTPAPAPLSSTEKVPNKPEVEISTRNGEDYIRAGDVVIGGEF